jgi:hypothetical protein
MKASLPMKKTNRPLQGASALKKDMDEQSSTTPGGSMTMSHE